MRTPRVSIIIPLFNRIKLIEKTLQSVLTQTYSNWECIIVDDGSTDGSFELVEKFASEDQRIQLSRRETLPKGAPACRNIGLEKSTGEYVIYLDSDDLLIADCLANRVDHFLKQPEKDFLVFQMLLFNETAYDSDVVWNVSNNDNDLVRFFRIDALWQTSGPIYKRDSLVRIGGFRETLAFWQDFDLHLRCLLLKLDYATFLDDRPDSFNRQYSDRSISRSIAFTSDKKILIDRIEFYFYQAKFIHQNNVSLTYEQSYSLWSTMLFFIHCLLSEHNDLDNYVRYKKQVPPIPNISWVQKKINAFYDYLSATANTSVVSRKLKHRFYKQFHNKIADLNVTQNTSMLRVHLNHYTTQES